MNTKEIGELRRRLRPGKNNIPRILGCYVNEKKEILSRFEQNPMLLPEASAAGWAKICWISALPPNRWPTVTSIAF